MMVVMVLMIIILVSVVWMVETITGTQNQL